MSGVAPTKKQLKDERALSYVPPDYALSDAEVNDIYLQMLNEGVARTMHRDDSDG